MIIMSKRCPWCGGLTDGAEAKHGRVSKPNGWAVGRGLSWCRSCGNWYGRRPSLAALLYGIILCTSSIMLFVNPVMGMPAFILCLLLMGPLECKIPKVKYPLGAWNSAPDLPACKVKIEWDKSIFMLNHRIWSGYILPVCFVDGNGTPQSLMWCVKLDVSKRRGNEMAAMMCFVKEEASMELFKTGNRFFVFFDNKKIGQGIVTAEKPT